LTALFSAIFAIIWLHERPSLTLSCGIVVIMSGVALIAVRRVEGDLGAYSRWLWIPIAGAAIRAAAQTIIKHALTLWPSPYTASLFSYTVSSALLLSTRPAGAAVGAHDTRRALGWFTLAGLCNGGAVLATYAALNSGPVSLVAPLTTTSPLFAALGSAVLLRDERFDRRLLAGILLTVLGAVLIVMR
jgi:drug/metabolite transporter (DMT)-like permease